MIDFSHFDNSKVINALSKETIDTSNIVFKELAPILNEIHELNHSERFWRLILYDYVASAISKKEVMEQNELEFNKDLFPKYGYSFSSFSERVQMFILNIIKFIRSFKYKSIINDQLKSVNEFYFSFPNIKVAEIENNGVEINEYFPSFCEKPNKLARKNLLIIVSRIDNIFLKNIVKLLPQIYVEHFIHIYNSIVPINPSNKIFHVHSLYSIYSKILIGKYIESKAKLFWYQHGGFYGEYKFHNAHEFEGNLADEFRTWGWKIKTNDIPWKAYTCEKFSREYFHIKTIPVYDCLIIGNGIKSYVKDITLYLLNNLKKEKYSQILCRPRPFHKRSNHDHQFDFIKNYNVKVSTGLNAIAEDITKSRIVIQTTVPSTNFLECLYVDQPTVGLLINTDPTDIIIPYYNFFISVGVLHNDPESLADHLNKIDLDNWWNDIIISPIYQKFKNEFLRNV